MKLISKRTRWNEPDSGRRGAIIVLFLALVMTVASVGLVLMRTGLAVTSRQALSLDGKNAFYLAESGLAESYWGLRNGKTGQVGTKSDPVYFGGGLFWVDSFPQGDDVYLLHATGMYGRGSVALSLAVKAAAEDNAGAGQGIFSKQSITIEPGVTIDGYDSNDGAYSEQMDESGQPTVLGSLTSNGNITLAEDDDNPVRIYGDVHAGPEMTLDIGEDNVVTGNTANLPELAAVDPVVIPTYSITPLSMTVGSMFPQVITGGDQELDVLSVDSGGVLVLRGPLNLVVDQLTVAAGGELVIRNTGGEVNLYSRSGVLLEEGSLASTESADPWQFRVRMGADDPLTPVVEGLTLMSTGELHGIIEAPDAAVTLGAGVEMFGSVTGNTVSLAAGTTFHVDASTLRGAVSDIRMVPDGILLWEIISLPDQVIPGGDPFKALGVVKSTLDSPYDAHRVLWLQVDYLDDANTALSWSGWATDADPAILRKVSRVEAYTDPLALVPVYVKEVSYRTTDTGDVVGDFAMGGP